jgi:hypothetical protein
MVNYSIIVTGKTTIEDNFLENRLDVCYYPRYIGFKVITCSQEELA